MRECCACCKAFGESLYSVLPVIHEGLLFCRLTTPPLILYVRYLRACEMAQHVSHPHLFQYTHYLLLEEPLWLLGTLRFTLSLSFCRHPHAAFHYLFLAFCRVSWYHLSNPLVLGLGIVLLQVDLLESERAFFDRERRSRERSCAIWNPTKDFFESLGLVQWHSLFNPPHERFLPHILWRKLDQGSVHFMSKMPCFPDQFFKLSEQNTDLKSAISLPHLIQRQLSLTTPLALLLAKLTDLWHLPILYLVILNHGAVR